MLCDREVSSYNLSQLTNYASTNQPLVVEDPSSDKEYLVGGSRSKSEDKARPKSPVAEESPTVEECSPNEACTERDNND